MGGEQTGDMFGGLVALEAHISWLHPCGLVVGDPASNRSPCAFSLPATQTTIIERIENPACARYGRDMHYETVA